MTSHEKYCSFWNLIIFKLWPLEHHTDNNTNHLDLACEGDYSWLNPPIPAHFWAVSVNKEYKMGLTPRNDVLLPLLVSGKCNKLYIN